VSRVAFFCQAATLERIVILTIHAMQNVVSPGLDGLPTCGSIRSGYSLDSAALGVCAKAEAIQRLLTIYWRVSSLLAITIYLLIAALPVGFIANGSYPHSHLALVLGGSQRRN